MQLRLVLSVESLMLKAQGKGQESNEDKTRQESTKVGEDAISSQVTYTVGQQSRSENGPRLEGKWDDLRAVVDGLFAHR